jgi:hypothetical protein
MLSTVLNSSEESIRQLYLREEFNLPQDQTNENFGQAIQIAQRIPNVVNRLINENDVVTNTDLLGSVRTLETVVIKSVNANSQQQQASVNNTIEFITNPDNAELVTTMRQTLAQDNADIANLVNSDFNFTTSEDVMNASSLPIGAESFANLAGMQLKLSDLDLGSAPNDLEDKELILYFEGEQGDIEGKFQTCVKFIDGASTNGTLGEVNTRGELASGFWSLLGASQAESESFSLLLTLTFLGTTYQTIIKPAGTEVINDERFEIVRFDFDRNIRQWHSNEGLVPFVAIPQTNAECREQLPSRVGL